MSVGQVNRIPHPTEHGGTTMSDVDSKLDQAKGKVKQAAGDLAGDRDLKREGKVEEASGNAKGVLEDLKDKAEDAVDTVKDELKKS
jgi:uncharacterized protein YjbJ (UPF0337 family)